MKIRQLKTWLLTLLATLTIAGCGESIILAEGGIGGTGISSGQVSGFGSVFVNGVKFDTREAQIVIDGQAATEEALQVGMTVVVYGNIDADNPNRGSASKIEFAYLLRGTVEESNPASGIITAAGQTIHTNELTVFAGITRKTLAVGDTIAVSGVLNAANDIVASYIALEYEPMFKPAPGVGGGEANTQYANRAEAETTLSGIISKLDPRNQTFVVGNQIVSYANTGLSAGDLTEGSLVQLTGSFSEGQLQASSIERIEPRFKGNEGDTLTLTGYVGTTATETQFEIMANPVYINADTVFANGSLRELKADSRIRVSATFNAGGQLVADNIRFLHPATIRISAAVDGINGDHLTLAGIEVSGNSATLMLDNRDQYRAFSLSDIGVGDLLTVYGRQTPDGIQLTRLERLPSLSSTVIQGPLGFTANAQAFDLLGINIDTTAIDASSGFTDAAGNAIDRKAFYSAIQAGDILYASGTLNGTTLNATTVSLK